MIVRLLLGAAGLALVLPAAVVEMVSGQSLSAEATALDDSAVAVAGLGLLILVVTAMLRWGEIRRLRAWAGELSRRDGERPWDTDPELESIRAQLHSLGSSLDLEQVQRFSRSDDAP